MKPMFQSLVCAGLLGLAPGCASSEIAPEKVAAPGADIAAAEEAGAEEHPKAAAQLKLAYEQYDKAKRLIKDGEEERAEQYLARANADAKLALELARLENTRRDAEETMRKIQQLKSQQQQQLMKTQ